MTTWDVDDAFALPRLDDVVGTADVHTSTVELTSTYYDTADRDLESHDVVLRRCGADDGGWELTIAGEGTTEFRADSSDEPPRGMVDLLTGVRLGKPLIETATIRTTRDRHEVTCADGTRFEVDDDRVRASAGDHALYAWRRVDVGSGPGMRKPPRKLVRRLRKAGATPARCPSNLKRLNQSSAVADWDAATGSVAIAEYLTTQIDQIFVGDLGLRRGQDPIHDTRVAIRRLRSTLRVFAKVLDKREIDGVEDELAWFAGLLGEVRDCHVQQRKFLGAVQKLPSDLVLGPVAARITMELRGIELPARQVVADAMASERYLELLTTLARWRIVPPVADDVPASAVARRARKAYAKADRRLAEALRSDEDTLLHRARKAAKRARYAAELQKPLSGKAERTVASYKKVQRVLGDFQDGVVATATLRRLGSLAGTSDGENGFTFGLLFADVRRDMERARDKALTLLSANS